MLSGQCWQGTPSRTGVVGEVMTITVAAVYEGGGMVDLHSGEAVSDLPLPGRRPRPVLADRQCLWVGGVAEAGREEAEEPEMLPRHQRLRRCES
jgi:hypothetical protein